MTDPVALGSWTPPERTPHFRARRRRRPIRETTRRHLFEAHPVAGPRRTPPPRPRDPPRPPWSGAPPPAAPRRTADTLLLQRAAHRLDPAIAAAPRVQVLQG